MVVVEPEEVIHRKARGAIGMAAPGATDRVAPPIQFEGAEMNRVVQGQIGTCPGDLHRQVVITCCQIY